MMRYLPPLAVLLVLLAAAPPSEDEYVTVFEDVELFWAKDRPLLTEPDGYVVRHRDQVAEKTIELPPAPVDAAGARRIIAIVEVEPIRAGPGVVPNDPWNRLGSFSVVVPDTAEGRLDEVELVRFVTGYGAPGRFQQDVTALAPLLAGRTTLRVAVSTYAALPGWRVRARLRFTPQGIGQRRPAYARSLFDDPHVTRAKPRMATTVEIPPDLARPRIRILSTGHATDGLGAHEFESATHVLRVDDREVARWRPWSEEGGVLRGRNPWAARSVVDGREISSSDFDRSGWHPGASVEPLLIPVPELTPGPHRIVLEILDIRPEDAPGPDGKRHHGYWAVSAAVVADRQWTP